ncbi:MAG: hypothetical protein HN742_33900 [Lentisphaerae bacterium]|jgi:hypothetical protein|nr:hypothetical protein [Lentisphaerota bacterium]MBT4815698.1 hypothetical protein [Lentisphaerota bacterium]MBT5611458.1 hypothetical protein [Lentisphaerota bacterium]MBT7061007.1 hypothetical protein [Lentisphaerota bacterium]MBT7846915.1 hypothetical protein [Lentisphaerota bacterium]
MQPIKPCNTYHAKISGRDLFRGKDGKTALKVYFVDIVGRPDPSRTVWAACGLTQEAFLEALGEAKGVEGIGFITAFPHITKVFRFGPENEICMNVRAWDTQTMAPIDLARSQDYVEFACLAEAALAADEFACWAGCSTVEEYLAYRSDYADGPISCHSKLLTYWEND